MLITTAPGPSHRSTPCAILGEGPLLKGGAGLLRKLSFLEADPCRCCRASFQSQARSPDARKPLLLVGLTISSIGARFFKSGTHEPTDVRAGAASSVHRASARDCAYVRRLSLILNPPFVSSLVVCSPGFSCFSEQMAHLPHALPFRVPVEAVCHQVRLPDLPSAHALKKRPLP